MADAVVHMDVARPSSLSITPLPDSSPQREEAEETEEEAPGEEHVILGTPSAPADTEPEEPPSDEDELLLQLQRASSEAPAVSDDILSGLQALPGTGQPLAAPVRAWFEPRFGHDFSQVRVHDDARASSLARGLRAHAFTLGRDIVFDAGRYTPHTSEGRRLLAHELTHVLQQGGRKGGRAHRAIQRQQAGKPAPAPGKARYSFKIPIDQSMAAQPLLVHSVGRIFGVDEGQASLYIRDFNLHWEDNEFQGTGPQHAQKGFFGVSFPRELYWSIRGRARADAGGTQTRAGGKGGHPYGKASIYNSLPEKQKRAIGAATDRWFWSVSGRPKGSALTDAPEDEAWRELYANKRADYIEDLKRYEALPQEIKDVLAVLAQGEGPPSIEDLQKLLQLAEQLQGLTPEELEELKTAGGAKPIELRKGAPEGSEKGLAITPFKPEAKLVLTPAVDKYVKGSELQLEVFYKGSNPDNNAFNYFSNRAHYDWTILRDGKVVDEGPLLEGWGSRKYSVDLKETGTYTLKVTVTSHFFTETLNEERQIVVLPEQARVEELFNEAFVGESGSKKPFTRDFTYGPKGVLRPQENLAVSNLQEEIDRLKAQKIVLEEMAKAPDPKVRLTDSELKAYLEQLQKRVDALEERQKDVGGMTPYLVKGIFLSRESSVHTELTAYMFGKREGSTYRVVLYDATLGKVATHDGKGSIGGQGGPQDVIDAEKQAIHELLDHWHSHNDYPDGTLHVGVRMTQFPQGVIERSLDTHNWRKTGETALSYTAAGAGLILLGASFFTGGTTAPVGLILLQGVAVGASAGVFLLKLKKRLETDTFAADQELTMDLLDLVSGVLGGVGSFGKVLQGSSRLRRGMYFTTLTGLDVGSGILLTASTRDQLIQAEAQHKLSLAELEKNPKLSEAEREYKRKELEDSHKELLARLLAAAAFSGGLLIVSAAGNTAHLGGVLRERPLPTKVKELVHRGSPEEIKAYLDENPNIPQEQRDLLELIYEGTPTTPGATTFVPEVAPPTGTMLKRVEVGDPLLQALPSSLREKIPVHVDPNLKGVRIHYELVDGVVTKLEIHLGNKGGHLSPNLLASHIPVLQSMLGYSGLLGRLRQMTRKLASRLSGGKISDELNPAQWEARLELEKLPRLIEERLIALRDGKLSADEAAEDILFLKEQMEHHQGVIDRGESMPKGFVAGYSPHTPGWNRQYLKLRAEREKGGLPKDWTGEMEAKHLGRKEAEEGYRWVLDKQILRYERLEKTAGPRRSWDEEKKAFVDVQNFEEARFLPPEPAGAPVDTDLARFEAAHPEFQLKQKVEEAVEGLGTISSLDELAAFRARKGAELDPLRRQYDANKDQQKLLSARKEDLDKLIAERQAQLAKLDEELAKVKQAPAEPKKLEEAAPPAPEKSPEQLKTEALEQQKAEANKVLKEAQDQRSALEKRLSELLKEQEVLSEKARPLYAAVTKVSEQLAEVTAIMYVKQKYPTARLEFGGPGSVTQSGVFDQVWRVPDGRGPGKDLWLVIEAKGGVSSLGERQVSGGIVAQQGSPSYFQDLVQAMRGSSNKDVARVGKALDMAEPEDISYLLLQAPYKSEGTTLKAGAPKVKAFDLGKREASP